jgi:hypothetical protein
MREIIRQDEITIERMRVENEGIRNSLNTEKAYLK